MKSRNKLVLGIILTVIGILGLIIASTINLDTLFRPWSFITGFVTGMVITLGLGLLISSLFDGGKK
jgi:hypothetical protein